MFRLGGLWFVDTDIEKVIITGDLESFNIDFLRGAYSLGTNEYCELAAD